MGWSGVIVSFEPIVGDDPKVLILGTMPSVKSLEKHQYYGHPRNQFWPILFELLGEQVAECYGEKVDFAKSNKIAVWDVLAQCERVGSLDSDINNETPNEIKAFLEMNPSIKTIAFNGGKAESSFRKFFKDILSDTNYTFIKLPSTSPAYTLGKDKKLEQWKILMNRI